MCKTAIQFQGSACTRRAWPHFVFMPRFQASLGICSLNTRSTCTIEKKDGTCVRQSAHERKSQPHAGQQSTQPQKQKSRNPRAERRPAIDTMPPAFPWGRGRHRNCCMRCFARTLVSGDGGDWSPFCFVLFFEKAKRKLMQHRRGAIIFSCVT